jgi:two-component system response regulator MprA
MPRTSLPIDPELPKVLMVEDDEQLVAAVRNDFRDRRLDLHHARTIAEALDELGRPRAFDAVVLDLNLPDGNGVTVADVCRRRGLGVPIIMVTARDGVEDRVAGLRHGADDYLCKPYAVEELFARLDAVWRRARPVRNHVLRYADIELDLVKRRLTRGETELTVSTRELDLLAYFMSRPEQILEKEQILQDVWGNGADGDANLLQVYANYLRNKLEGGRYPRVLHTVRGVGYILSEKEPKVL